MTVSVRKQTSIRVDPEAWEAAKKIFKEYGLTASDAINVFLNKVRLENGLPFDMKLPSERLKNSINELKSGEIEKFESIEELVKDLKS